MKMRKITAGDFFFSLLLAGELAVILDTVSVLCGRALSVTKFGAMVLVLLALALMIPRRGRRLRKILSLTVLAAGIILAAGVLCWRSVSRGAVYDVQDEGKAALYANRRVMLLVPHQDDDINVLGGVMEEYIKYGSEVTVVFSTNGDYHGLAQTRFQEALDALGHLGVPEDHVIFLGYGDQWSSDGPHLYNAGAGEVMTSVYGATQTYGTDAAPAWKEGRAYTIDNFLQDIEDVILAYRPDVLYCVDYDYNIDHRALSHAFEKVMGKILKETDYRPLVLKGYAYNTAWEAVNDFYADNLQPTRDAFMAQYNPLPGVYSWANRVRLPVNGEGLSRSVITARQNEALSMYASQGAELYGVRVINSDKVFWLRRTDSLCLDAQITATSGNAALLNDFMLLECDDLLKGEPHDGVWIPEGEGSVTVTFAAPEALASVVLYDHPHESKNILNARIEFSDGSSLETGPLYPGGSETVIAFEARTVTGFTVTLLETEGEAGLTEIEAFGAEEKWQPEFVKIMDEADNFVYDYWMDPSGSQTFTLYDPSGMAGDFSVFCLNQHCSTQRQGDRILVNCPEGEKCVVYVTDESGQRLDTVTIRNPGSLERGWKNFWLGAEELVLQLCESRLIHKRLFVCRLAEKVLQLL